MSQYIKLLAVLKFYSRIVLRKLVVSELEKFRKVERLVKNVSKLLLFFFLLNTIYIYLEVRKKLYIHIIHELRS